LQNKIGRKIPGGCRFPKGKEFENDGSKPRGGGLLGILNKKTEVKITKWE